MSTFGKNLVENPFGMPPASFYSTRSKWLKINAENVARDKIWIFSVCAPPPPSLVGAYYLQPPDARAIFLHNDLLCNDTCSVTGGSITYWGGGGGTNGKDPKIFFNSKFSIEFFFEKMSLTWESTCNCYPSCGQDFSHL